MRRIWFLLGLLLATLPAAAQDLPRAEVFGGYSYLRVNPGGGVDGINLNGWNASVAGNLNNWFGVVGDFSGHYGTPDISGLAVEVRQHSYTFGPRFSYRQTDRVTPFAHALFGASNVRLRAPGTPTDSETALAVILGGGVDVKANDSIAVRVVQADYFMTRFEGPTGSTESQHNLRLSFGVVFRFGR